MFGEIDRIETYQQKLYSLHQTKSVTEYLVVFQTYSPVVGYNDTTIRDMFYAGLKDNVKGQMMAQNFHHSGTTTFNELSTRAIKIDNRIHQREAEKKPARLSSSSSGKTTQVSSTTTTMRKRFAKGDSVYTGSHKSCLT
jgi:hypothetical protein